VVAVVVEVQFSAMVVRNQDYYFDSIVVDKHLNSTLLQHCIDSIDSIVDVVENMADLTTMSMMNLFLLVVFHRCLPSMQEYAEHDRNLLRYNSFDCYFDYVDEEDNVRRIRRCCYIEDQYYSKDWMMVELSSWLLSMRVQLVV